MLQSFETMVNCLHPLTFDAKLSILNICGSLGYTSGKLLYNPGQNMWNKIEKSSKTGQVKKSLISTFACFLSAIAKV